MTPGDTRQQTIARIQKWTFRYISFLILSMLISAAIDWAVPFEHLAAFAKICALLALSISMHRRWEQQDRYRRQEVLHAS